jgi:hypothetical protein
VTLKVAFYGDLFRPQGHLAMGDPPFDSSDVDALEAQLLEVWWREAATIDPQVVHPDARTPGHSQRLPKLSRRPCMLCSTAGFLEAWLSGL